MSSLNEVPEYAQIMNWTLNRKRSPRSLFSPLECDAEVFKTSDTYYSVINLDSVSEEWQLGLITEAHTLGHFAIEAALSDMAAVGARLKFCLDSLSCPPEWNHSMREEFFAGIHAALSQHNIPLIGGDIGSAKQVHVDILAVGTAQRPVSRKGMAEGDILYTSGLGGLGCALLGEKTLNGTSTDQAFRELKAPMKYAPVIEKFATACTDTSDGFLNACHLLSQLNHCDLDLTISLEDFLHPRAAKFKADSKLPPWAFLAGEGGDYELLWTISAERKSAFENAAQVAGLCIIQLGQILRSESGHESSSESGRKSHTEGGNEAPSIHLVNSKNERVAYQAGPVRSLRPLFSQGAKVHLEAFLREGSRQNVV